MKFSGLILLLIGTLMVSNSCSQTAKSTQREFGKFIAASPCLKGSQPLPGIPQDSDCEFIKLQLTLYANEKNEPTNYKLEYTYGIGQPGTEGFKDGKKVSSEGKWQISKGSKNNSSAVIYQLDPDKPEKSISFIKLSEGILHLLDNEKRLMIGTAGFSYTLNKVTK
jgi:NlpE-like protein